MRGELHNVIRKKAYAYKHNQVGCVLHKVGVDKIDIEPYTSTAMCYATDKTRLDSLTQSQKDILAEYLKSKNRFYSYDWTFNWHKYLEYLLFDVFDMISCASGQRVQCTTANCIYNDKQPILATSEPYQQNKQDLYEIALFIMLYRKIPSMRDSVLHSYLKEYEESLLKLGIKFIKGSYIKSVVIEHSESFEKLGKYSFLHWEIYNGLDFKKDQEYYGFMFNKIIKQELKNIIYGKDSKEYPENFGY
jgi:hypothetical protein